jgi:hypothetical protein
MNRLRVWLYVALLLLAVAVNLYLVSRWIGGRSLAAADRQLRAGSALLETTARQHVAGGGALDAEFAKRQHAATGLDVTLVADGKARESTLPSDVAQQVAAAAGQGGKRPVDVGRLGAGEGGLLTGVPELRSMAAPPAQGVTAIVSVAMAPHVAGLAAYQLALLLALLLFLVLGWVLARSVAGEEGGAPAIPRELLQAADDVARGDYSARVPQLAGTAGVVGMALNKAAEAAEAATLQRTHALRAEEAPPATEAAAPAEAPAPAAIAPAAVEPVPVTRAEPERAAPPSQGPARAASPAAAPRVAPVPPASPVSAAAPAAPDEESHWRETFDDFVRTRGQTGEAAVGPVSYDRFRTKLQKNREQLVERFGCRTVRFQVYVKEGKAAVRATPVR